jgi:putative FmdB family regulatory protein
MPIYEYACQDCGLYFEQMRKLSESDAPMKCPDCSSWETQKLVSVVNHTFAHKPVNGPVPQNTGVHSIDYNADRVIGRDAEQKWALISERQKHKREVIKSNPGSSGHDLSRTHEGDYRVMKPEERKAVETARSLHNDAMKAISADVKKSSS